jgi:hypothetical protein
MMSLQINHLRNLARAAAATAGPQVTGRCVALDMGTPDPSITALIRAYVKVNTPEDDGGAGRFKSDAGK